MTAIRTLLAAFTILPLSPSAAAESRPPDPYTVNDLVTDDMSYAWVATRGLPLFARPGSRRRVATVARGEVMQAQALQLRGHPWEVLVLWDHGPFRAGMRLWILARDMEEGYYEYWYRGQTRGDILINFDLVGKDCGHGSEDCWLRFAKQPPQEDWVLVRTERGVIGWLLRKESDDFIIRTVPPGHEPPPATPRSSPAPSASP
jgi:hypothetical protein